MTATDQKAPTAKASKSNRTPIVVGVLVVLAFGAVVGGVVWWALATRPPTTSGTGTEQYRPAWESALKKAGVEATLPPEPTEITRYQGSGSHPFEATFTAEEATALLNVYTLTADIDGQQASVSKPSVGFPAPGEMSLKGNVRLGDQSASAQIAGKLTYTLVERLRAPQGADVSLEGFALNGADAQRATDAALRIGNQYLIDAPKLTVVEAEIVDGGVRVKGQAPNRIALVRP